MNWHRRLFGLVLLMSWTIVLSGCAEKSGAPEAGGPESAEPAATADSGESSPAEEPQTPAAEPPATATTSSTAGDEVQEPPAGPPRWANWRGPANNGTADAKGLVDELSLDSEHLLWKSPELATRSTPVILNDKLYVLARDEPGTKREGEKVICADPNTGEILWENKFNVYLSDVPDTRVAWSNCVADPETGNIYALGVCGYFACIDGETGKTKWSRSLHEEFGLLSTYGGRTNSPIVHEDLVVIGAVIIGWGDMAKPADRYLGLNKLTGEVVWINGTSPLPEDTTYSTPVFAVFDGQKTMTFGSGDGRVWSFQPRTGLPIWNYQISARGLNVTPVVDDENDVVFMGQSEENPEGSTMGAVAAINGRLKGDISADGALWKNYEQMVGKSSPIFVDGRLYAAEDSGGLLILDARSGEEIDKVKLAGTIMRASLLYADGKIYACTTSVLHVLKPTEDGVEILHRQRLPDGEEVHGSPITWRGRVIVPTTDAMYCWSRTKEPGTATELPKMEEEAPVADDQKPAHLQIVPAETLIQPGEKVKYTARLFNSRGQLLKETEATYSVDGHGKINKQGVFTANADSEHAAVVVTAEAEGLTGTARLRIVPPLPWQFDFTGGEVPITWVGARYRHVIREEDGNEVMVKVTTIPKGTRSQAWMGPPNLSDYTIQADVLGREVQGKMPDIGLIAQRYTLDLMGASQVLQIRTWTPQLERFSETLEFPWKPDVWYTMKFRAAVEDGQAVLRGKVWPRDEEEPKEWQITAIDARPNTEGSPGLYGNAKDAELFLDNLWIASNEQADKGPPAKQTEQPAETATPTEEPKPKPKQPKQEEAAAKEKAATEPAAEKKAEPPAEEKPQPEPAAEKADTEAETKEKPAETGDEPAEAEESTNP